MARLIAKSSVLYQSRMFKPGDFLPASDPIMRDAWLEAGTAALEDEPDEIAAAEVEAKATADAEAAEAEAKARAYAEAAEKKAKASASVKAKTEASVAAVKEKADAEAKAKADAEAKNGRPAYDKEMKLVDLQQIAIAYGVDASKMQKKADVIAAIQAAIVGQ